MTELGLLERLENADANRSSLTHKAYKQLEELIVTLQVEPGAVLSEAALSKQLSIGRTPIREALQRLAREGLVSILPRRGILVTEMDVRRQLQLLELRRELERLMARAGAKRANEEERAAFREIAQGMEAAAAGNDDIVFMRLDRKLNLLLVQSARNEFVASAMSLSHGLSRRFWYSHYKQVADLPLCARLHANLARAVAEGDPDVAARTAEDLIDYVGNFTRATLDMER